MVKTPVNFYVPCNRRNKRFVGGRQPINNCRLEALGIVGSRTWCTFLQLARNNMFQRLGMQGIPWLSGLPSLIWNEYPLLCLSLGVPPVQVQPWAMHWTLDVLVSPCQMLWMRCSKQNDDEAYCAVKFSSGSSASSPILRRPFLIKASTLQRAWIVLPKWRPWCTSGSVTRLSYGQTGLLTLTQRNKTEILTAFF
jgi:hypothetical protein